MVFPPQRPGGFGPTPFQQIPNQFLTPNRQMMNIPNMPQPGTRGIGSIIRRFLPFQSQSTNPMGYTGLANMANSGISSGGGAVGGISNTLGNIQQILKVVETSAPMVQQYGPMIKNLPAMFRMMKAFKDIGNLDDDEEEESSQLEASWELTDDESSSIQKEESKEKKLKPIKRTGESVPKLFI